MHKLLDDWERFNARCWRGCLIRVCCCGVWLPEAAQGFWPVVEQWRVARFCCGPCCGNGGFVPARLDSWILGFMDQLPLGQDDVTRHTDEELERQILHAGWGGPHHTALVAERQRRQFQALQTQVRALNKPHWTLMPTFWISLGILVASVAILIVTLVSWLWPSDKQPLPGGTLSTSISNSAETPTNSPPASTPSQKVLPPESSPLTNNQSTN